MIVKGDARMTDVPQALGISSLDESLLQEDEIRKTPKCVNVFRDLNMWGEFELNLL